MASFGSRGRTLLTKFRPKLPEKWKGGRLERIGGFFMNIVTDYQAAVKDMVQDMKDAPRKAAFYLALLGSGVVLAKTNPSEVSFQEKMLQCHHEMLLLGDRIRNRHSDTHVDSLMQHYREGTMRYANCGFFSLMWVADHDPAVDTFEARCGLVKPRWVDFHKQVVDVGALGRWHWLHKAMLEYDINVDEWDEEGRMRKSPPQVQTPAS